MIIAFQAIDLHLLDIGEAGVQACAAHTVLGDDEVVVALGAQHHHGVDALATLDAHGSIDVVFNMGVAAAAHDGGVGGGHAALVGQHEGTHHEVGIAVAAVQLERCLVAVDHEGVVALGTVHRGGVADAARQEAQCGLHGADLVAQGHGASGRRAVSAEDLTDLHIAATQAAIDGGDGAVVVDIETVVAVHTIDRQAARDGVVVVDALHGLHIGLAAGGGIGVWRQVGHEVGAQEQGVVTRGAVDGQVVGAGTQATRVVHVHRVIGGRARQVDDVVVVGALAVQVHLVLHHSAAWRVGMCGAHAALRHGGQLVQGDGVVATDQAQLVAQHARPAHQFGGTQGDEVGRGTASDQVDGRAQSTFDGDGGGQAALHTLVTHIAEDGDGFARGQHAALGRVHVGTRADEQVAASRDAGIGVHQEVGTHGGHMAHRQRDIVLQRIDHASVQGAIHFSHGDLVARLGVELAAARLAAVHLQRLVDRTDAALQR